MMISRLGRWTCWVTIVMTALITSAAGVVVALSDPSGGFARTIGLVSLPIRIVACVAALAPWWTLVVIAIHGDRVRQRSTG